MGSFEKQHEHFLHVYNYIVLYVLRELFLVSMFSLSNNTICNVLTHDVLLMYFSVKHLAFRIIIRELFGNMRDRQSSIHSFFQSPTNSLSLSINIYTKFSLGRHSTTWATQPAFSCVRYFKSRVLWTIFLGWCQTAILLMSASYPAKAPQTLLPVVVLVRPEFK
jgi:hypothetical protein